MSTHEFIKPEQNAARDDMFRAMKAGAISTSELITIGKRHGLFHGETTGMIGTLKKRGNIYSPQTGWWTLAPVSSNTEPWHPESVGEVESISPNTLRVGDVINHKGVHYYRHEEASHTLEGNS